MTTKKQRQRGSRTHGGGSGKNRRGAGHRGGRGGAGRDKHEFHNHEPLGKDGFERPENVVDETAEINVQKLDEDAALLVADDEAEMSNSTYRIDVRDIVEDGYEVDRVKVLGTGKVRNKLHLTAHTFTDTAHEKIEAAGGEVSIVGEESIEREEVKEGSDEAVGVARESPEVIKELNHRDGIMNHLEEKRQKVAQGQPLEHGEVEHLLEEGKQGRLDEIADIVIEGYENKGELSPEDALSLYRLQAYLMEDDSRTNEIEALLDDYFEDMSDPIRLKQIQYGVDSEVSVEEVEAELREIEEDWENLVETCQYPPDENGLVREQKKYLLSVREAVH